MKTNHFPRGPAPGVVQTFRLPHRRLAVGLGFLLLTLVWPAVGATTLSPVVTAAGGGAATAASYSLGDTAGQPAIGPAVSANYTLGNGFWHDVNEAPVAPFQTFTRGTNLTLKIRKADVLAGCLDADGDTLTLMGVGASSQGAAIATTPTHILYTPANNHNDAFSYTVSDNDGGSTTGTILVNVVTSGGQAAAINTTGGAVTVRFAGIPGFAYAAQRATDVHFTQNLTVLFTTNAPTRGVFTYTDATPPSPTAYYRLMGQ